MTEDRSLYHSAHLACTKRLSVCVTIVVGPAMLSRSLVVVVVVVVVVVYQNTCGN